MNRNRTIAFVISAILILVALVICIVSEYVLVNLYAKIAINSVAMLANIIQIFVFLKESTDLTSAKETLDEFKNKLDSMERSIDESITEKMTASERTDFLLEKLKKKDKK